MLLCDVVCVLVRKWEVSPRNGGGKVKQEQGKKSLLWARLCKRTGDGSRVKFLKKLMEAKVIQGWESRMARALSR